MRFGKGKKKIKKQSNTNQGDKHPVNSHKSSVRLNVNPDLTISEVENKNENGKGSMEDAGSYPYDLGGGQIGDD